MSQTVTIDSMISEVRNDSGDLQYRIVQPNILDGDTYVASSDSTIVSGDLNYRIDIPGAVTPVKVGDGEWQQELYNRDTEVTHRIKALGPIGFDVVGAGVLSNVPVELQQAVPLVDGIWDAFNGLVRFEYIASAGGLICRQRWDGDIVNSVGTAYYGMLFECDGPAADVVAMLSPDRMNNCAFLADGNRFVEYFPEGELHLTDRQGNLLPGLREYLEHDYTTISGNLTEDTTWTAGTYYLTASPLLGAWNLTLDAEGGGIFIKTNVNKFIDVNGSGNLVSANTSNTNKIIFTSKNDDSRGEAIAGSSGTPAKGDQSTRYLWVDGTGCDVNMEWLEAHYSDGIVGPFTWANTTNRLGNDITLRNVIIRNCGLTPANYVASLIGMYRYRARTVGTVIIEHLNIDETCDTDATTKDAHAICFESATTVPGRLKNIYIKTSSGTDGTSGIWWQRSAAGAANTVESVYVGGGWDYGIILYCHTAHNQMIYVNNCICDGGTLGGLYVWQLTGTFTINVYDTLLINCDTGGAVGLKTNVVAGTDIYSFDYNGYYNNDTNSSESLGSHSIQADPELGVLPDSALQDTPNCCFPDGLAVRNYASYEKKGSDTFDNLGIDETVYSMTGYQYGGAVRVTPGVYYTLSILARASGVWLGADF